MLLQSLLTKLGAAGLAAKAAAGGTAVVVAASAAGAADALPEPAQDAFERITAEEVVEAEAEDTDEGEGPAEGSFGARVSQDATGDDGSEPGVDGATIACEASEGRSGTCDEDPEQLGSTDDEGPEEGSFGARVSQDATGEDESGPGVEGRDLAEEAKANGNGDGDGDTDDDGDGGLEGTPGEDAVNNFRPDGEG